MKGNRLYISPTLALCDSASSTVNIHFLEAPHLTIKELKSAGAMPMSVFNCRGGFSSGQIQRAHFYGLANGPAGVGKGIALQSAQR